MARFISTNVFWSISKLPISLWGYFFGLRDEDLFSSHFFKGRGSIACLGFSSGRASLCFTLKIFCELRPGADEVIVPLYVCSGVIDPIVKAGLRPVFCDIEKNLNICPKSCIGQISKKTLAIIVPHTYGYPAKIEKIISHVKVFCPDIYVIDDAASGLGNQIESSFLGLKGDVGIFSLNQGKALPTTGGGFLSINRSELKDVFSKRYQNIPAIKFTQKVLEILKFTWNFKYPYFSGCVNYYLNKYFKFERFIYHPLYGYRLSKFDEILAKNCFENNDRVHIHRREIIKFYCKELDLIRGISIPQIPGELFLGRFCVHIPGLFRLKFFSEADPVQVFKRRKIHFQYGYPSFAKQFIESSEFDTSFKLIDELLILPVNFYLTVKDHSVVIDAVKEILEEVQKHS